MSNNTNLLIEVIIYYRGPSSDDFDLDIFVKNMILSNFSL